MTTETTDKRFDIALSVMGTTLHMVNISAADATEAQHLALVLLRKMVRVESCGASREPV